MGGDGETIWGWRVVGEMNFIGEETETWEKRIEAVNVGELPI